MCPSILCSSSRCWMLAYVYLKWSMCYCISNMCKLWPESWITSTNIISMFLNIQTCLWGFGWSLDNYASINPVFYCICCHFLTYYLMKVQNHVHNLICDLLLPVSFIHFRCQQSMISFLLIIQMVEFGSKDLTSHMMNMNGITSLFKFLFCPTHIMIQVKYSFKGIWKFPVLILENRDLFQVLSSCLSSFILSSFILCMTILTFLINNKHLP